MSTPRQILPQFLIWMDYLSTPEPFMDRAELDV